MENKDPCRDCIILEKALRFMVDIYSVDDEYEGDEREEKVLAGIQRVKKMFTGKE